MKEDEPPDDYATNREKGCKSCGKYGYVLGSGLCPSCSASKIGIKYEVYKENKMDKYSPTWISDNFPISRLECQYIDICKHYIPEVCQYDYSCSIRSIFREYVESYVAIDCLHEGIIGIINEGENEK